MRKWDWNKTDVWLIVALLVVVTVVTFLAVHYFDAVTAPARNR